MQNLKNDKFLKNNLQKYLLLGGVGIFGVLLIIINFSQEDLDTPITQGVVEIGEVEFSVHVADTPALRTLGLSGRDSLARGTGLFFVFDEPGMHGFWMKDMNFAIDIVWITEDLYVDSITRGAHPDSFPQVFYPASPVVYVLEVPAGDAETIKIGDSVSFRKTSR